MTTMKMMVRKKIATGSDLRSWDGISDGCTYSLFVYYSDSGLTDRRPRSQLRPAQPLRILGLNHLSRSSSPKSISPKVSGETYVLIHAASITLQLR